MTDVFGVPAPVLLLLAASAGGWLLLLAVLTTATRPRPVRPGPATFDLGEEPPALVNLLTGGWRMTEDALSATLLDLAARDMIDLVQSGPDPARTVCVVREEPPAHLTAYERRVYDRVAGLASGGIVPVAALARGNSSQAGRWWKGFRKEVIVDAQRRGLSRNRWGAGVKTLFSIASLVPAGAVALTVGYAADEGDGIWGAALLTWAALTTYVTSRNRQRDTPAGREAAARWLGVRQHLGRNEVFDTLPPAAVAIWDRYLGYGAATGVAGTASRVLSFGAQDERLAWSAYGGNWHRVRIRYPGSRAAEGRHPAVSALIGALAAVVGWYGGRAVIGIRRALVSDSGLGLTPDLDERLDNDWTRLALLVLLGLFAALALWGAWTMVRAALDTGGRRTFEAEVLRIRMVQDDEGAAKEYQVALDDGRSERTRAWSVAPKRMPALHERDVVSVTAGPRLRYVAALSVARRAAPLAVDEIRADVESQVVTEAPAAPAGAAASWAPLSAAEVGAALGRPVDPPKALLDTGTSPLPGMRMVEFAAVGGPERVVVQSAEGRLAAAVVGLAGGRRGDGGLGSAGGPGGGLGSAGGPGGDVSVRTGSVVLRRGDSVIAVHVRHADPATTETAVRRLAELLGDRAGVPGPA